MAEQAQNNITSNNSELYQEKSQKENNSERTFTGTKLFGNLSELNNSGK